MPRGIPNSRLDDTSMRFTSFIVPPPVNPKHSGSTYLKSDSQTIWARNNAAAVKSPPTATARRGSNVLVIHPGSRFTRIGRASDVFPVTVPTVVARKTRPESAVQVPTFHKMIYRPGEEPLGPWEDPLPFKPSECERKIGNLRISLHDRMHFYKLRVAPNATTAAKDFNEQERSRPEIIPQENDPYRVEWITETEEQVLIGEKALRIADTHSMGYTVRRPLNGIGFNTRDYQSAQLILSDIETLIQKTLEEKFGVLPNENKLYSVVLVIPDYYDRSYVREWTQLLLVTMGFKQICVQQESLAATYGAGISNACVVDIGAGSTSISCVDEGLVVSDTRLVLNFGGDEITEFLFVLLNRIGWPYPDMNLALTHDWDVLEDLKARLCTLAEGDVAINLYDFVVRRPQKPTEKFALKVYDEIIIAPMLAFEPSLVNFPRKRKWFGPIENPGVSDEVLGTAVSSITQAMTISTLHLTNNNSDPPRDQPSSPKSNENGVAMDVTPPEPATVLGGSADAPLEIDVEDEQPSQAAPLINSNGNTAPVLVPAVETPVEDISVDIFHEASTLPLDVAIFNSARSAGGDDKIRKYLQAVLVIGGGSLIPGMSHALESRLQAIASPLVHNMEKVQIIPPPKDVDARVVVWKGAAVFGKMDGIADLWVTPADWDMLGMRGLKERCFFLN